MSLIVIVTGDDMQTQVAFLLEYLQTQYTINHQALPCLLNLLTNNHKKVLRKKLVGLYQTSLPARRSRFGKHACVDLTGVSPLVGLRAGGFTAGLAALKAATGKANKHEKSCMENQQVFIPFAFDTFGFFAPDAVELLNRVQQIMHCNESH